MRTALSLLALVLAAACGGSGAARKTYETTCTPASAAACSINGVAVPCDLAVAAELGTAGASPREACEAYCAAGNERLDGMFSGDGPSCGSTVRIEGLPCDACCGLSDQPPAADVSMCDDDPCTVDACDATGCRHEPPAWLGEACVLEGPGGPCGGTLACDPGADAGADLESRRRCVVSTPPDGSGCVCDPGARPSCAWNGVAVDCGLALANLPGLDGVGGPRARCEKRCADPAHLGGCFDGPEGRYCVSIQGLECRLCCLVPVNPPGPVAFDNDPCTADACEGLTCRHDPLAWVGEACDVANAFGTCKGKLRCSPCQGDGCDGPVVRTCVGPEPGPEVPDGKDNDCDGLVDETDTSCDPAHACDDGVVCTNDGCAPAGVCVHELVPGCCDVDADCPAFGDCLLPRCTPGTGCAFAYAEPSPDGTCCPDDAWCAEHLDDGDPCTDERCVFDREHASWRCGHVPSAGACVKTLPYVDRFDTAAAGWTFPGPRGTPDPRWRVAGDGLLGPDPHLVFTGAAAGEAVSSRAVTPHVRAADAESDVYNPLHRTTVQWRMAWRRGAGGGPVTLRLAATDGKVTADLWRRAGLAADVPFGLHTATVPESLRYSPTLHLQFVVEAADGADVGRWEIDDVAIAAGVPNRLLGGLVVRCPETGGCGLGSEKVAEATGALPALAVGPSDRFVVISCHADPDGTDTTWKFWGYPAVRLDGPPFQAPPWVAFDQCSTVPQKVLEACGPEAGFLCMVEVKPAGAEVRDAVVGLAVVDESGAAPHSPFESLAPLRITASSP